MSANDAVDQATIVMSANDAVVAVTVTYNSDDVLDEFLASIIAQQGDWRLIVVDNNSSDNTLRRLAVIDDARITIVSNDRNVGFAAATNIGIRAALDDGAHRILLLNNDTTFEADLFSVLTQELAVSGADSISPVIVSADNPQEIWYAGGHLTWLRGLHTIHDNMEQSVAVLPTSNFYTSFCPACCMMFDPSVFEKIGLLDEDFFVYWEDAEFCERMRKHGLSIIVSPRAQLHHKAGSLTGGIESDFYIDSYNKNRMIVIRKCRGLAYTLYASIVINAVIIARWMAKLDSRRKMSRRLKGVRAGLTAKLNQKGVSL